MWLEASTQKTWDPSQIITVLGICIPLEPHTCQSQKKLPYLTSKNPAMASHCRHLVKLGNDGIILNAADQPALEMHLPGDWQLRPKYPKESLTVCILNPHLVFITSLKYLHLDKQLLCFQWSLSLKPTIIKSKVCLYWITVMHTYNIKSIPITLTAISNCPSSPPDYENVHRRLYSEWCWIHADKAYNCSFPC